MWGPLGVEKWGTQVNSYLKELKEPYAKVRGRTDEAEGTSGKAPRRVFEEHIEDQSLRGVVCPGQRSGVFGPSGCLGTLLLAGHRKAFRLYF